MHNYKIGDERCFHCEGMALAKEMKDEGKEPGAIAREAIALLADIMVCCYGHKNDLLLNECDKILDFFFQDLVLAKRALDSQRNKKP